MQLAAGNHRSPQCSPVLRLCLRDGDSCKVALSCYVALDLLTIGNVQVARAKRYMVWRIWSKHEDCQSLNGAQLFVLCVLVSVFGESVPDRSKHWLAER